MISRLITAVSRRGPTFPAATMIVLLLLALGSVSCRRQTAQRGAPAASEPVSRVSLQEEEEELEEMVMPQLEQEKQPGYTFNSAENVFDINLDNASLRQALQSMCDMLDYNLVMDSEISDSLTISLRDITFNKFMEVALHRRGYEYRMEDNFVYVDLPGLQTRVFSLDYLNASRQLQGQMNITGQAGEASGSLIPQSNTQLQTQNTVNLWSDIRNSMAEIVLGQGQQLTAQAQATASFAGRNEETGHKLVVEPNSGVIQVTADKETLRQAEEFITSMEASLQRQVLIEARFVEINLNESHDRGLDWTLIPDLTSVSNLTGALAGGAVASQALSPNAREFQIGVSNQEVNAIMTAISRHGNVDVLQSPQVSTLNNQPAVIRVARNETFFQRQETPGQPATATSPATQPVVNYIPIQQPTGVVLNLTPQVSDDGTIIMAIRPSITSIAAVATSPDGLSTSPITDIRELDTVAKVRHGQTIILAGLIQERDSQEVVETPLLSKLPLIGGLFRQVREDREKIELVILLTPYINFSRTNEELAADQHQLSRYREVSRKYELNDGKFREDK